MPHVRIRGGGVQRWAFLLRLFAAACGDEGGTTPTPVALASDQGRVYSIAADDSSVYWVTYDGCQIMRVDKASGVAVTLASGQRTSATVAVDGGSVYFATTGDGSLAE
jgi:hypothetical protein